MKPAPPTGSSILTDLMTNGHRVIVSELFPRQTVDTSPYNDRQKSLCDAYEAEYGDSFKSFLLASDVIPDSYLLSDKGHLN